ncbi:MAG: substrate-binding domain-containing protein, partial [Pseudomonadota bacterium]
AELLDALEARLAAAGWTVAIAFHRDDEGALARFATVLAGREAEALIVLPGSLSDSALTEALAPLEQSGAERIRIGGEPSATAPSEGALVTVPSTPEPGHEVRAAVERLLADGRRRIALIGGALDDPQADIRGEAYRAALDAAGVPWDQWLWFRGPSGPERAMTLPTPVDALIAWDGPTAAAVRELAALYGRRLEVDLGFVALDAFASAPDPGHLADEAVAALHDRRPGAGPASQSTAPNAAAAATSPAPAAQPSVSAEPESPAPTPVRIDPVAAPDLDPEQMDPVPLSTLGLLRRTG